MIARRSFLISASLALLNGRSASSIASSAVSSRRIYIGTGGDGNDNGIFVADWDAASGAIGELSLAAAIAQPTFLAARRRRDGENFIYAVTEVDGEKARLSAFTTEHGQKQLTLLNQVTSLGDGPTHVSVSPDGRTVLVANYTGGSVTSYAALPNGSLSEPVSHFQFSTATPGQKPQDRPHAHFAATSPDGRFVLVNDLGLDRVMIYHLDPATARMTAAEPAFWQARPRSGPRHLAWSPSGRYVYCSNELDSTVDVLAWNERPLSLKSIGFVSSLPEDFPPRTAALGEIVASRDGRNVYAGNRVANDNVAAFDVDRRTGLLKEVQLAASGGKNARHITLDPTDRWLVISHQTSNDLVVLERNRMTGKLSEPVHSYSAEKPMCVIFV